MKPPLWVAEAGIWKDSSPLVFVMVVIDLATLGSLSSNLVRALLFLLGWCNMPEKINSDTMSNLSKMLLFFFLNCYLCPGGEIRKLFRSRQGFLFHLSGVLILDQKHDMATGLPDLALNEPSWISKSLELPGPLLSLPLVSPEKLLQYGIRNVD